MVQCSFLRKIVGQHSNKYSLVRRADCFIFPFKWRRIKNLLGARFSNTGLSKTLLKTDYQTEPQVLCPEILTPQG